MATRENEARKIHIGCPEGPSWGCGTNLQKGKAGAAMSEQTRVQDCNLDFRKAIWQFRKEA